MEKWCNYLVLLVQNISEVLGIKMIVVMVQKVQIRDPPQTRHLRVLKYIPG